MKRREWLGLALATAVAPLSMARAQAGSLVIFAAASLKNALDEVAAAWTKETGKTAPKISYGASSALAKQMEQGAPADLFISADIDWMDYVEKKDLIKKDTRVNLLGNKIVLIAPKDSKVAIDIKPGFVDSGAGSERTAGISILVSSGAGSRGGAPRRCAVRGSSSGLMLAVVASGPGADAAMAGVGGGVVGTEAAVDGAAGRNLRFEMDEFLSLKVGQLQAGGVGKRMAGMTD